MSTAGGVRAGPEWEEARERVLAELATSTAAARVELGSGLVLLFTGGAMVRVALEERLRADRVTDPELIDAEAEAFGAVAAREGELTALLLVDTADPATLGDRAAELDDVARSLSLLVGSARIPARADDPGFGAAGAVPLRFAIDPASRAALASGVEVEVDVDHPSCRARARLAAAQVEALADRPPG